MLSLKQVNFKKKRESGVEEGVGDEAQKLGLNNEQPSTDNQSNNEQARKKSKMKTTRSDDLELKFVPVNWKESKQRRTDDVNLQRANADEDNAQEESLLLSKNKDQDFDNY